MATVVAAQEHQAWARTRVGAGSGSALGLIALIAASLALRASHVGTHLWMDEGITVGIAGHPLGQIPGLLRLDGAPPLYYVVLHLWMGIVGASDVAVHWLSVLLAAACVPAAWWSGTCVADRRTGWIGAVLVACCPFVTSHAPEARMYSLVVLLGLLCVGCFVNAYVRGRSAYRLPFGVALALSLYSHNWALFTAIGFVLAVVLVVRAAPSERRAGVVRDALVGFGVAGVLYAPWVPTLLFQASHTGAPWATAPPAAALLRAPEVVLHGEPATVMLILAAGAGLAAGGVGARRAVAPALGLLAVIPILLGWGLSQASPIWDARYLAVIVAPLLLLVARGLAYAGRAGIAALILVVALWAPAGGALARSDAFHLGRAAGPLLHRGDLVVATPFAEIPLLARYLPPGLRYASPLGPVDDPRVVDWRDVARRMAQASTRRNLLPLLDHARVGAEVLLVVPAAWDARSRETALGREERRRSAEYVQVLLHDARLAPIAELPRRLPRLPQTSMLRGVLLRKVAGGRGVA